MQQTSSPRVLLTSQAGQSMTEFLVVLPVLLLLILGAVQFALIYHAKITLNYAAFEAVRAGTLGQAKFEEVKEGFARGMAPLYSYYESDDTIRNRRLHSRDPEEQKNTASDQVEAFQLARNQIYDEFDSSNKLIRIERLNPTDASFLDFSPDADIPNDTLRYRESRIHGKSKSSIQDSNLLHLRITYWYPLYVPLVNKLIFNTFICCKNTGGPDDPNDPIDTDDTEHQFCKWGEDPVCIDKNQEPVIPLTSIAVMRMQTPAVKSDGYYSKH